MKFISVMEKLNFHYHYSSRQSHDPSEIIQMCWFTDFIIIINVENSICCL